MEIVKRMTSRVLLAAAAAITVAIATIAVLPAAPASAQSEEETTGRIVARLLDDGRVEFGWQPAGGARVLPRQRYFPTDATIDRWLRSSPIEVEGTEIGRINARLRADGRIEFAFTPTDGERITPQARYFPAGARVGRWLRSTEITIGPAAPPYTAVSAGVGHTCAIRESGEIACWGDNSGGQSDAPEGSYTAVSAGFVYTCAIRAGSGAIDCWGSNHWGNTDAPDGSYRAISAGYSHTCAIRDTGETECWPNIENGGEFSPYPPSGSYIAVDTASSRTCVIRDTQEIECWGIYFTFGPPETLTDADAPDGRYTAISVGSIHACAIRDTREIECWPKPPKPESGEYGESDAPEGSFTAVSAGGAYACAIRTSGELACWGRDSVTERTDAPEGNYTAISAGRDHACAIRTNGEIECWGQNYSGQTDVPTD